MSENELKWDIPVESVPLPSSGIVYPPDSVLYGRETLKIKAMTAKEEDILSSQAYIKEGTTISRLVSSCLDDIIVSIDGVSDRLKIKHFILNMPALDSRKFRLDFKDSEPGIDMKWEYSCQNCNTHHDIVLPINSEFFWPTT
jgi:hypothetical protein